MLNRIQIVELVAIAAGVAGLVTETLKKLLHISRSKKIELHIGGETIEINGDKVTPEDVENIQNTLSRSDRDKASEKGGSDG
jgi:hypothetical protein